MGWIIRKEDKIKDVDMVKFTNSRIITLTNIFKLSYKGSYQALEMKEETER